MFCQSCGTRIEDGVSFCPNCGKPVTNATESGDSTNTAPLLERAFIFLEDGKWCDANIYCEKVLDIEPKNAQAYLGKLMAELQVRTRDQLANCSETFDGNENFVKAIRFGDEKLSIEMRGYIDSINKRNEELKVKAKKKRKKIIAIVIPIIAVCIATVIMLSIFFVQNTRYNTAMEFYNTGKYEEAIKCFKALNGYRDSKGKIESIKVVYSKQIINDSKGYAVTTEYTYDSRGNAIKEVSTHQDGTVTSKKHTYTYDSKGNILIDLETDPDGLVGEIKETYIYDGKGNKIKEVWNAGDLVTTYEWTYDDKGNKISSSYTGTDGVKETTTYTYTYTYNNKGNMTKKVRTSSSGSVTTYTYDDIGNMIKQVSTNLDGGVRTYEYTYDNIGNEIKCVITSPGGRVVTYENSGFRYFLKPQNN